VAGMRRRSAPADMAAIVDRSADASNKAEQ